MSNVKIRDVRAILTEPEPGSRFTVVKIETTDNKGTAIVMPYNIDK